MADKCCRAVSGTVYFLQFSDWRIWTLRLHITSPPRGVAWAWLPGFGRDYFKMKLMWKTKQQETTGQKKVFLKIVDEPRESTCADTRVQYCSYRLRSFCVARSTFWKKTQNQSTNQAEQHLAQTVWLLHIRGQHRLRQEPNPTLFSETLWVAVFLSNHTGRTGDTLYSFLKSKRRVNGLLEKANANPINQSLGWHQALS